MNIRKGREPQAPPPRRPRPQTPRILPQEVLALTNQDYQPRTLEELRYWREVVLGLRGLILALLNQTDAVLGEIDSRIDIAKYRIENPAARCRFCGVKIVFRRTDKGVKAYNLDETLHECWRVRAKA